jgi:hypothetical protein
MKPKRNHGSWFLLLLLLGLSAVLTAWVTMHLHVGHVDLHTLPRTLPRYISIHGFDVKKIGSINCAPGCSRDSISGSCRCGSPSDSSSAQHQGPQEARDTCLTHATGTSNRCGASLRTGCAGINTSSAAHSPPQLCCDAGPG